MSKKQMFRIRFVCILFLLSGLSFTPLHAAEYTVSSISALQTTINSASSGDIINLANGTYSNNKFDISKSNITVRAATAGSVYLSDSNAITISGNGVTFSGFQFTSGSIYGIVITVNGNNDTCTQLNFDGYYASKYININGQYDVVSYCNFKNKPVGAQPGNLIHIAPTVSLINYAKIRYCSFQNMPGAGGDNGNECIRIANGDQSAFTCRTIVEYCYFNNTGPGDSEVISVKCQENVIRFNTNTNNQQGNFCFRNGNNNVAYGNFFINAGGIRVKEANNIWCYNNYFQNCGDGSITAPVKYVYVSPNLNNINFIHNTFVDGTPIELDANAVSNTWANNIFKKISGDIFTGSASGIAWAGNIRSGNLGITISSGMTNIDPLLTTNADGYYSISASSPAVNAASASYPSILDIANIDDDPTLLFDISGRARPATVTLKDVGANEYTTGTTTNHPLALSDVGPQYLGGPNPLPVELQSFTANAYCGCVELIWSTATEVNNVGFDIERRVDDGQWIIENGMLQENWEKLGFAEGHGTTNAPQQYYFNDTPVAGKYLYRLRQIDRDGKFEYSPSVPATITGLPTELSLNDNFPNPFNPVTKITFTVPSEGRAVVTVFDVLGKEIATVFNETAAPGRQYSVPFNASPYASGIYFSRLEFGKKTLVKKMMLTK